MSKADEILQQILKEQPAFGQGGSSSDFKEYRPPTAEDLGALEKDIELERKYGDKPIEAALSSAASSATLGLSDAALRAAGVSPERMSEVRERSPVASGLGTAVGIAAPVIATAGLGAPEVVAAQAGKGIAAEALAATPMGVVSKGGQAIEKYIESALARQGRSKALQKLTSSAASNAAEGAAYGLGDQISESALGKSDFTAQNAVASAGAGAMLGLGFGSALGSARAVAPTVQKTLEPLTNKVKSAAKSVLDAEEAAQEIFGGTLKSDQRLLKRDPDFYKNLPSWTRENLGHDMLSTPKSLYEANQQVIEREGKSIAKLSGRLDEELSRNLEIAPTNGEVYGKLRESLRGMRDELEPLKEVSKSELQALDNFTELVARHEAEKAPFRFQQFNDLRQSFDRIKWKNGAEANNIKADIAKVLRTDMRQITNELADRVSNAIPTAAGLAEELKLANKNYSIAKTIDTPLFKRANSGRATIRTSDALEAMAAHGLAGPAGLVVAAGKRLLDTDLRRNAAIVLSDLQRQKDATLNLIKQGVDAFVDKSKRPAKSLSLKSLVNSGFAVSPEKEAPKNKKQAFNNIQSNIIALKTNPDLLVERLAKATGRLQTAAPQAAQEVHNTLVTATNFLDSKLPKSMNNGTETLFQRPYQPSSMELAKFERYVQAVEHPLSVLEDLQRGTLTREHVEAVKAVYPALYGQIQQQTMSAVSESPDMSYTKKLQLGILLDIPTDQSLEPYAIAGLQSTFAPPPPAPGPQQGGSQTAKFKPENIHMAERELTETQRIAGRKTT